MSDETLEGQPPHPSLCLSIEEIRELLARKHQSNISDDDPVLMLVTIFNAVLDKAQQSQEVKTLEIVRRFEEGLAERLQPITEEALKSQIHAHLAKMRESGEIVERLMHTFKRCCFWLSLLGLMTCTVSLMNIYLMTR